MRAALSSKVKGEPRIVAAPSAMQTLFAEHLLSWHPKGGRHNLPWQNTTDPYRIWLSEIMLQQTQVSAVVPYYLRFLAAFPDIGSLAAASQDEVMELWSGLGYYSRARNLHACARAVVESFDGRFPTEPEDIATLPGIGRSSAAAIAAFAFGARAPILDGNVKRVLCRAFGIALDPARRATEDVLWQLAEDLMPRVQISTYTQAIMDLGATVCTPKNPRCTECPLGTLCVARREGTVELLPVRKLRRATPTRPTTFLFLHHAGQVLLVRRPPSGIWGGLWCLPEFDAVSIGQRGGDSGLEAAREFASRHGSTRYESRMADLTHAFTHFRMVARVLAIDLAERASRSGERAGASVNEKEMWLPLERAASAGLPAPHKALLVALAAVMPSAVGIA